MKKLFCLLLILFFIPSTVFADVDLSGMSFDELVALRNQVTTALFYSDSWKEIYVPGGFYQVGNGIPSCQLLVPFLFCSACLVKLQ